MKLKHHSKYILFVAFISCIALLSINLTNRDGSKIEGKSSRIIIKSTEKGHIPDINEPTNDDDDDDDDDDDEGTRVTIPATNEKYQSPVHQLPISDANAPIIITPLT